jgi:Lipocalin-like domain
MRACLGFSIIVAALSVACGDSGSPTAPSTATLMGTWNATRAEYVSRSNQSVRVDAVARGTSMVLTLNSGTFTLKITDPGQQGNTLTGTWSSSKEVLKMSPSGMTWSWEFDMTFTGNTLTLNNGGALYDVNDDGREEEAVLNMTLTRQ